MILINDKPTIVCLDPGHGGHDPGAVGPEGTRESETVLKICKEIMFQLDELGIDSYMTRTEDDHPQLADRVIASEGADCMVSVHCNAHSSQAQGIETIYSSDGGRHKALANYVQQSLMKYCQGHKDRKIKMSPSPGYPRKLFVLATAKVPTCLTEVEFISNIEQEKWLASDEAQRQIAHAIAQGIKSFLMSLPGAITSEDRESRALTSQDRDDEGRSRGSKAISTEGEKKVANSGAGLSPEIASLLDTTSKQLKSRNARHPEDEPIEAKVIAKDTTKKTGLKRKTKRKSKTKKA